MDFDKIKEGMKLKLVSRGGNNWYRVLKIGVVLTVGEPWSIYISDGYSFVEKNPKNNNGFYVDKKLACCWEPIGQSLKDLINN